MGKAEGSFPSFHDTTTLWQWVKEINKANGSDLRATAHIMGTAWKWAQKICYTLKTLCYGWQQAAFLGKDWTLTVTSMMWRCQTAKQLNKASKEDAQMKKSQDQLKSKVLKLSNDVKKCKEAGYSLTCGRTFHKLPFQCSKQHWWNLKQKRKENCVE